MSDTHHHALLYIASFIVPLLGTIFQTLQMIWATVGILSGTLWLAWVLSLHVDKINSQYGGDWKRYLKSFKTQKPK